MDYLPLDVPTLKGLLAHKRNSNLMSTNDRLTKLISYNLASVGCLGGGLNY